MKRLLASAAIIFTLSACASALQSATQDVTVLTPGAHESVCFLDNGATRYRAWPPETIKISKRPGELKVRCLADGNRERTVVVPVDHEDVVLANATNGFLPGMFIDYHTGAMFVYPDTITVDFTDIPERSMGRPAYDLYLLKNPDLYGMEEFRPGRSALIHDMYAEPVELEKRDFATDKQATTSSSTSSAVPAASSMSPAASGQDGADAGAGGNTTSSQSSSDVTSQLTRQMNPQVFGPQQGAAAPVQGHGGGSGISGGDDGGAASTGPVTIYPIQ